MRRDLVLNEISLPFERVDEDRSSDQFSEFARSVAALVVGGAANNILRMAQPLHELSFVGKHSVYDVLLRLLQDPLAIEAARYLMRLSQKCPLLTESDTVTAGRFLALDCHSYDRAPAGLLYSFASGSISMSFLSAPIWDAERVSFDVVEMDTDGELHLSKVSVDNVARPGHAKPLSDNVRKQLALELDTRNFWLRRNEIFSSLAFGKDVEGQITTLDEATFRLVLTRLMEIDLCLVEWQGSTAASPVWRSSVSPESTSTMNNPKLASRRVFRGGSGEPMTFEMHARYGSSGRIHFAVDASPKSIVVGYIGPHLPLS